MKSLAALIAILLVGVPWPALAQSPPAVAARPPPHQDAAPRGPGVEERLAEIARRVQRSLHYPAIARSRGVIGEALVAFEIGADGSPRSIALVETSGSGALDRAALRAVAEAAPLPFVYGRIQVPVRFALDSTP